MMRMRALEPSESSESSIGRNETKHGETIIISDETLQVDHIGSTTQRIQKKQKPRHEVEALKTPATGQRDKHGARRYSQDAERMMPMPVAQNLSMVAFSHEPPTSIP